MPAVGASPERNYEIAQMALNGNVRSCYRTSDSGAKIEFLHQGEWGGVRVIWDLQNDGSAGEGGRKVSCTTWIDGGEGTSYTRTINWGDDHTR